MGRTDFLFCSQGFLDGISRSLDVFGVYDDYNISATPEEADRIALSNDWLAVADDMNTAIEKANIPGRVAKK